MIQHTIGHRPAAQEHVGAEAESPGRPNHLIDNDNNDNNDNDSDNNNDNSNNN